MTHPEPHGVEVESGVYCYVGLKPGCGCCECASVDLPEFKDGMAKDIAEWIKDGYTIERRPVEWVRKNLLRCKHAPAQPDAE